MENKYFDTKTMFMDPTVNQYGSNMVMTNVHKPTKRKYVNIDTRYCDDNNKSSSTVINGTTVNLATCDITLPQGITEVKSIMVCDAEIPMSFYNISENLGNNSFTIGTSSSDTNFQIVKINDGQYTVTSIITEINRAITAIAVSSYRNITVSSITNNTNSSTDQTFCRLTVTGGSSYFLNFAVNSTGTFDKYNLKSKLGWLLGFRNQSYTVTSSSVTTSEALIDINGPRYMYLVVDEFGSSGNQTSFIAPLYTSLVNRNILARITFNTRTFPYGSILPANNFNGLLLTDKRSYTGKTDLQRLRVQLVHENGNIVSLNGLDFSFCLEVEHE
jgi:hypothetical protein